MKKIVSVILTSLILLSLLVPAFAADSSAALPNIYGDNMLFRQKTEAVFRGTAGSGARIDVELMDASGNTLEKGCAYASKSGTFSVSFNAPAGSYENYTVNLYENGTLFRSLKNVTFGELWLASGQSNMQYSLSGAFGGMELFNAGTPLDPWVRALYVPPVTSYMGSTEKIPAVPQNDIEGAFWMNGSDLNIYGVSAVAYYFAEELRRQLDMPVGIISASLGGSSIGTWLSREAIDNDPAVKEDFAEVGEYIGLNEWNENGQNMYYDMTANYDLKIAPLAPFRISGMIWYQGETDVIYRWKYGRYSRAFDLMQRSYSELFGFEDGMMPIVWTSLAAYYYFDDFSVEKMNYEFTEMRNARPQSRALISIYDVPLDYTAEMGSIHPGYKQPVGERMADAAMGLVYGGDTAYIGTSVKNAECREDGIYVTLDNTGSGLVCGGDKLFGFSVCGENGVYVQAEAEIVSADTVRIYSGYVAEPVSAAYAYSVSTSDANLFVVSDTGEKVPAACFVTDFNIGVRYTKFSAWADCEAASFWRVDSSSGLNGLYDIWEVKNADLVYDAQSAFSGMKGLHVVGYGNKEITLSPKMTYKEKMKNITFSDTENDLSDYGILSFRIRNNGDKPVVINELRLYKDAAVWYSPALKDDTDTSVDVPADGEWHTVEYDLNRLYLFGNKGGAAYSNEKISGLAKIDLKLNASKADIALDEFRFAPETEEGKTSFDGSFKASENMIEFFCAFFTEFIARILKLFPSAVC